MADYHFVRIDMTVPQVGTTTHVAELETLNSGECALHRIIELDPNDNIRGAGTATTTVGMASAPQAVVPHPDTYADYPDITATTMSAEDFEALWRTAVATFPELT